MVEMKLSVWSLIREDLRTQREGLWAQGFWALLVYRISNRRLRLRKGPVRFVWGLWAKVAHKLIEFCCGISLPEGAQIGRRLRIEHFGGIILHSNVVIGDDCLIRQNVTLGNRSEARPFEAPKLGNGVHIGAGAVILGAIELGDGVMIGANAVVMGNVPAGAKAVGNPARVIGANE
jgi:serine O-acetyltransferase